MKRGQAVSVWVLIAALGLAIAAACANSDAPTKGQWGGGIYVQQSWSVARAVSGHHTHVLKEKIACAKCHAMSGGQMGPVTPERCAACHAEQAHIEHASSAAQRRFGANATSDCTSCHAFTLEGTGHDAAELLANTPPAPADADAGMRPLPPEIPSYEEGDCKRCHAMQQGDVPAVQAHATQPCLSCHRPHQDATPRSAPCSSCHENIHTNHAASGKSPEQACETCHENQHAPAKDAVTTCALCHSKEQPLIPPSATFADGHTDCISCHRPHEFGKEAAVSCRSCHEDLRVLGGAHVAAHANCESCHQPHDVKAAPEAACASCHKDVHSDHPGRGTGCIGCHDPHPEKKSGPKPGMANDEPRACTSCHQDTGSEHGQHAGVACTGCHQPHHFDLEPTQLATCTNCHGQHVQQVSTNKGHAACTGCHQGLPHHPEELEVGCDTCHQQESERVNAGHARCNECHEPHSGAQSAPCASCHASESQTAPRGHQDCTGCHEPHTGTLAGNACSSCHAEQAASPHGKLSNGCLTCHRPHGPDGVAQPPSCTSCHELAALPGLHIENKHQNCMNCHSGHEHQAAASRDACLGCHSERKDHFPGGRCANCHLFTPTR